MAPWRAAAAFPTPLSFSRSLVRKMVRERWRISRETFDLDAEGRGQALYRIAAQGVDFHFLAISDVFPADQKIDRAFGINWDVSAALCEGTWDENRRAFLAAEVPRQYDGRFPADMLCFCRGNRSERVFDHVVDALAAGTQPDTALLASVGYLLRSTAFAGNGLFGMKPFEALGQGHPLGATYHAQILAAYLLRTFVFDLAEHVAAARSTQAIRLDPAVKRYLGLGNSAGLGLVPFIMSHPQIIHQWCFAQESAFAEMLDRKVQFGQVAAFRALLHKACRYFRQDQRDGNGIFADYSVLADQLGEALSALERLAPSPGMTWRALRLATLPAGHHPETGEAWLSLLLELFPDIVERWDARLLADEHADLDPAMSIGHLADLARGAYGWLGEAGTAPEHPHFWYYPQESPYEPRRGLRGTGTPFETETPMDLPRLLPRLLAAIGGEAPQTPVGVFLSRHPQFLLVARRVQALAGLDYAELRVDSLAPDYLPFAACRFLLAFYGMEKYDPRLPRSTKGALLQGAPLPEEIAAGIDGDWPFPIAPETASLARPAIMPQRLVEQPDVSIETLKPLRRRDAPPQGDTVTVFPAEMRKLLARAVLGVGLGPAAADAAVRLALLADEGWIDGTLSVLARPVAGGMSCDGAAMIGAGLPDFAIAPHVLDLAGALASTGGTGVAHGSCAAVTPLLGAVALWGAGRGFLTAVADVAAGTVSIAGGPAGAVWQATFPANPAPVDRSALTPVFDALRTSVSTTSPRLTVMCRTPTIDWPAAEAAARALGGLVRAPDQVAAARRQRLTHGFGLSRPQFDCLYRLAGNGLVPPGIEPVVAGRPVAS